MSTAQAASTALINLEIEENTDYNLRINYTEPSTGLPVDLTNYEAELYVDEGMGDSGAVFTLTTGVNGGITLSGSGGQIVITIASGATSGLGMFKGFYSLFLVGPAPDFVRTKISKGFFTVSPSSLGTAGGSWSPGAPSSPMGYSGYSGFSGSLGPAGTSGYSGFSGATGAGTSGYSGFSGGVGLNGVSGYSGISGATGVSGYSGISGATGVSGYSGTNGSGVSGYSGYSGLSNPSSTSTTYTAGGTTSLAYQQDKVYYATAATGATTWAITGLPASGTVGSWTIELTNGGLFTQTWFTGTKWNGGVAPTLTSSGTDILTFYTRDGGSTIRGFVAAIDSK